MYAARGAPHFLTCLCVCVCMCVFDASLSAKPLKTFSGMTKGQTQCYQTERERGSLILDAAA